MSISPISSYAAQSYQSTSAKSSSDKTTSDTEAAKTSQTSSAANSGVIYEKSAEAEAITKKKDNSAIISQLKADAEARTAQMQSLVQQMMKQQGSTYGIANDMWSFLAGGKFTVTAAAKAQAQQAISENGYWGVEQTSDRIVQFAKALAGDNPDKADELLAAFKKGYQQATGAWGKKLPDISSQTYDAVVKKFDEWKNGSSTETAAATGTEA